MILFGNKTKVPLDYINGSSMADINVEDSNSIEDTWVAFISTMSAVHFRELILPAWQNGAK